MNRCVTSSIFPYAYFNKAWLIADNKIDIVYKSILEGIDLYKY